MQPNELKAVLAKTKEVAVIPAHIEIDISNRVGQKNRYGRMICPRGLVKATVIQDGYKWMERRPVAACGAEDYEIPRRNGVLVEIDHNDFSEKKIHISGESVLIRNGKTKASEMKPYPHTTAVHRDGKTFIRLIISRKAVVSDWDSYALIEAAREKEHTEHEHRERALREPQAAIMGMTLDEFEKAHINNTDERELYLNAEWHQEYKIKGKRGSGDWDYVYVDRVTPDGWTSRERVVEREIGIVQIPLAQVEKILSLLTPKQRKALAN